jgi:hypothetical protein
MYTLLDVKNLSKKPGINFGSIYVKFDCDSISHFIRLYTPSNEEVTLVVQSTKNAPWYELRIATWKQEDHMNPRDFLIGNIFYKNYIEKNQPYWKKLEELKKRTDIISINKVTDLYPLIFHDDDTARTMLDKINKAYEYMLKFDADKLRNQIKKHL